MKILVTGATGFIGSNILKYLHNGGYTLFGCGRKQLEQTNYKYIVCDLTNDSLNLDVDVIIHTAALNPSPNISFTDYFDNNIVTTMNLLKYAKLHDIKRIIYMGAVSSYGEVKDVLRKNSPINNPSDYGLTKYVAEKLVRDSGIPYYTLILPGVVGMNCGDNWIMNTAQTLYSNQTLIYYNGQGMFNNILEVQDLCQFINKLLEEDLGKSETYLLGSSEMMTVEDVVRFLRDKFFSSSLLSEIQQNRNNFYLDVSKALYDGFSPKPIKNTLEIVCDEVLRRNNS